VFEVQPVDERDAQEIVAWNYGGPYAMYTMSAADVTMVADPASRYYTVRDDEGELVAFIAFGEEAQVPGGEYREGPLDVGCGIRPDLTGQGLGPAIIRLAIETGEQLYGARDFRATIAAFNERAQKAAAKAGFRPVSFFERPVDDLPFVILERPAEAGPSTD
jgi:RimJ/RimL family protein N-acetyltransferase